MDNKKINELPVAQNLGDTSLLPVSVNMGSFWQTFKLSLSALKTYILAAVDILYAKKTSPTIASPTLTGTTTISAILSTGIAASEYADNAEAVADGMPVGGFYRTGDILKIVHE